MTTRYEVTDKTTGLIAGVYTKEAVEKIGFKKLDVAHLFLIKKIVETTEYDCIIAEGRF